MLPCRKLSKNATKVLKCLLNLRLSRVFLLIINIIPLVHIRTCDATSLQICNVVADKYRGKITTMSSSAI